MQITFRPALAEDFEYCRRIYFAEMQWILDALHLDTAAHAAGFERQWNPARVRILKADGVDAGWIESTTEDDALLLAQIFVERTFQRRGIGTEAIRRVMGEAARAGLPVRLGVVKINPAVRLYERLGFRTTHEDERKLYMRREPGEAESVSL